MIQLMPMSIRRVVPDIECRHMDESRAFYGDSLGLKVGVDMGFIMTFESPINPTAPGSVRRDEGASALLPNVSIEVADVDEVYAQAIALRLGIVYPLTDEPWGVRRFFAVDRKGTILSIMSRVPASK